MKVIMDFDHSRIDSNRKRTRCKTFNKWFEELKDELKRMPNGETIRDLSCRGLEIIARTIQKELQQLFPEMNIPLLHTTPNHRYPYRQRRIRHYVLHRIILMTVSKRFVSTNRFCRESQ